MQHFLQNLSRGISGMFQEGYDDILFYILAFLIFFNRNTSGDMTRSSDESEGSYVLFFGVLFLFLLINSSINVREQAT